MTYIEDEGGTETSQPREAIEIRHGLTVYRIATGTRDVIINGNTFKAGPASREKIQVVVLKQDRDFSIQLPTTHPFAQRYNRGGIPPKNITCALYRKQLRSGENERIRFGEITSCSIAGGVGAGAHTASFLVVEKPMLAMKRELPSIPVGRACPYTLYEAGCRVARASFRVATTVASHDGARVTVATMSGHPSQWARAGELLHLPTGERMTISDQTGSVITIQLPIFELKDGDAVHVFAGCNNAIPDCRDKFDNLANYGGEPLLPKGDVYLPNGYGTYQSEPDA